MSAFHAFIAALAEPSGAPAMPGFTGGPYIVLDSYPAPAQAGVRIEANGDIDEFTSTGSVVGGTWDNASGGALNVADYDFRFDVSFGSVDTGAGSDPSGVWLSGASLPSWLVEQAAPIGVSNAVGTLRMRNSGGGPDIDTESVNLGADLS